MGLLGIRTSGLVGALACGLAFVACKSGDDDASGSGSGGGGSAGHAGHAGTGSGNAAGSGLSAGGMSGASGEAGVGSDQGGTTTGGSGGRGAAGGRSGVGGTGATSGGSGAAGGAPDSAGGAAGESGAAGSGVGGNGFPLVKQVAAGNEFSCALLASGTVKCWGQDGYGTLGDGLPAVMSMPVATAVIDLGKAKKIAVGGSTACAIRAEDDSVLCWGFNQYDQLAVDPSVSTVPAPVALNGFVGEPAKDVSLCFKHNESVSHGCVIDASDQVGCWGANDSYQLGVTTPATSASVIMVPALSGYASVVGGEFYTCGLTLDHGVKCWGGPQYGELGDNLGASAATATPVDVVGLTSGVKQIAGGDRTVCALTTAGGVKCWGSPAEGALGVSDDIAQFNGKVPTPMDVVGLSSGVAEIAGGAASFCALMASDGSAYCWGYNQHGQVGNQPNPISVGEFQRLPVQVIGLTGATTIAIGANHACAAMGTGGVKCWGSGWPSGNDSGNDQLAPNYVRGL